MGTLTYPYSLTAGQAENVNHLNSNLTAISNVLNGSVDADNLAAGAVTGVKLASAVAAATGVNGASTRRGKCIIATEESTTSTSYTTLTTPDQVSSIVLPSDGLVFIAYQALVKHSAADSSNQGYAAIFLGSDQLKIARQAGAPAVQEASFGGVGLAYTPLVTSAVGLTGGTGEAAASNVTTGQLVGAVLTSTVGGFVSVFAAAGTYTISVKYKASSTYTTTAKERKLWVWSMGFD